MLNESRKKQLVRLLAETGNLPIYCPDDTEVTLRAGYHEDGSLFAALFDLSFGRMDRIPLCTEKEAVQVEKLDKDGKFHAVSFTKENGTLLLDLPLYPMDPVILRFTF